MTETIAGRTCERCDETKELAAFGTTASKQPNPLCRTCAHAAYCQRRRERAFAANHAGQWFAMTDDDRHECERCHAVKGEADFPRGHGGGRSRWRKMVCKRCLHPEKEKRVGGRKWLILCPRCRAKGIVSLMAYPDGPCHPDCGYGAAGALPRSEVQETSLRVAMGL